MTESTLLMMDKAEEIANLILKKYASFGKRGKPSQKSEWIHLAAFCVNFDNGCSQVLSIGTGTKCLGASEVDKEGASVNDSHAEILARRALIRYLILEIRRVLIDGLKSEIFVKEDERVVNLRDGVKIYFFTTFPPCGDASIVLKPAEYSGEDTVPAKKQKLDTSKDKPSACSSKVCEDIYRTGAKCTQSGPQDSKFPGTDYHILGAWRIKPGRGERTLSMSCSDKVTKWAVMGVQGAALMRFLAKPICIDTIIVGGRCPYSKAAFHRAIIERNVGFSDAGSQFRLQEPQFIHLDNVEFRWRSTEEPDSHPSFLCKYPSFNYYSVEKYSSFVIKNVGSFWHDGMDSVEVLVDGYKQGVTKSKRQISGRSTISRRLLVDLLLKSFSSYYEDIVKKSLTYCNFKRISSPSYTDAWKNLKLFYCHYIDDARKLEAQKFLIFPK